jgi:polyisoprenoid-binding protein YceI
MRTNHRARSEFRRIALVSCGIVIAGWLSAAAARALQAPQTFAIDAANSRVAIEVGRSGMFGFAGHDHEVLAPAVTGRVTFVPDDWSRSSVALEFDASALKVTGKGDPPADVPKVQAVMLGDQVLDVNRFHTVAFRSRRVRATPRTPTSADLVIDGDLTLHGTTRPMTIRAIGTLAPDGVTGRGAFTIKQTEFAMTPVTAGGGTVRVKDEVRVAFDLRARRQ